MTAQIEEAMETMVAQIQAVMATLGVDSSRCTVNATAVNEAIGAMVANKKVNHEWLAHCVRAENQSSSFETLPDAMICRFSCCSSFLRMMET